MDNTLQNKLTETRTWVREELERFFRLKLTDEEHERILHGTFESLFG